jgi:hypothetical protein
MAPSPAGSWREAGVLPSGFVDCPELGTIASSDACAVGKRAFGPLGIATLSAERSMLVDRSYPVRLMVGLDELQHKFEADAGKHELSASAGLRLGDWICAELHATNFNQDNTEKRQCKKRGGSPQVRFDWKVSPTAKGRQVLAATVQSLSDEGGTPFEQIDSNKVSIAVHTDSVTWIEELLDGAVRIVNKLTDLAGSVKALLLIVAAIIAAVSLIIWRWKYLGRRPEPTPPAAD